MSSRLELIIGPMYAGKSTELVRIIQTFKCLNKSVIVINHSLNNRYNSINLTTHNNEQINNCIVLSNLKDLENAFDCINRLEELLKSIFINSRLKFINISEYDTIDWKRENIEWNKLII